MSNSIRQSGVVLNVDIFIINNPIEMTVVAVLFNKRKSHHFVCIELLLRVNGVRERGWEMKICDLFLLPG